MMSDGLRKRRRNGSERSMTSSTSLRYLDAVATDARGSLLLLADVLKP
jgi:hypothetical protein